MAINDVWRNIGREIGVYWNGRFDRVPLVPGVYAWFYPLRITSRAIDAFLEEINKVFSFDACVGGPATQEVRARFAWEDIGIVMSRELKNPSMSPALRADWDRIVNDEGAFDSFRRVVLRGSIFVPPLYVGKTQSLGIRCRQHIHGTGKNDFHDRFESYAKAAGLSAPRVDDLVFACIQTQDDQALHKQYGQLESLVEEILKCACRPAYGCR